MHEERAAATNKLQLIFVSFCFFFLDSFFITRKIEVYPLTILLFIFFHRFLVDCTQKSVEGKFLANLLFHMVIDFPRWCCFFFRSSSVWNYFSFRCNLIFIGKNFVIFFVNFIFIEEKMDTKCFTFIKSNLHFNRKWLMLTMIMWMEKKENTRSW